jgi:hypothetical protein
MTQAVGYISGRSEVAYTASFLLAFLAGRRWMLDGGRRWWLTCVGLWLMAMLTKESAAMLPFVLLAYDWLVLDADWPARRRRFLRLGLPLVSITFLAGAGRLAVLGLIEYPDQAGPDWRFALVAVDAFWRYVGMLAVPRDQSIFHAVPLLDSPFAPRALAGLLGLGVLIAAVWWLRQVHSLLAFGLAWFTVLLVPSSVLFVMGMGEPMAEHRIYLSAAGFFLIGGATFGLLWTRAGRGRLIVGLAASLFILQLGLQTLVRNAVWQDPIGLSREAAALAPDHWMPRVLFGEALRQNGRCDAAIPEYRAAIAMRPAEEFPYTKLAGCLIEGRRLAEAEGALQQLRAVNPTSEEALMGLSVLAVAHGRKGEAGAYLRETLRQAPDHQQARLLLAFLDDALPAGERVRLCQDLKMLTGDPPPYEGCV